MNKGHCSSQPPDVLCKLILGSKAHPQAKTKVLVWHVRQRKPQKWTHLVLLACFTAFF